MRTFTEETAVEFVENHLLWGAAAGTGRTEKLAVRYASAHMSIVGYGSVTMEERPGNKGDNFYQDPETHATVNSWGIPNLGIRKHVEEIPRIKEAVNRYGAQFWPSISAGDAFVPAEYGDMAHMMHEAGADVIDGNFSCGNMKLANGTYKPVVCYDTPKLEEGVAALKEGAQATPVSVKLTPMSERSILMQNIAICVRHEVEYIVLANTVPNCYMEKPDGTPAIAMGRGGLGGRALIPIVTGMLQMTNEMFDEWRPRKRPLLIAAGGVEHGRDAYHYLKHGADGFVFSSLLWANNFDPKSATEILSGNESIGEKGLVDLLVERGLPNW